MVLGKININLRLSRKLQDVLPRTIPLTPCKSFIRPYVDIIYDITYNLSFHEKVKHIQYSACLA